MENPNASFTDKMKNSFGNAKEFVLGREDPESQGTLAIFNFLPNTKSYMYAAAAFGVAGLFLFLSLMVLPMVVLSPSKFVCCFSLSMCSMIVGLSLLKGVRVYIKDMFNAKNPKNSNWYYDEDSHGFKVDAYTDIKKDEEVFYTYGRKSNYKWLMLYAYLEEDNDFNTFPLDVELPDETETDELKRDYFFH